MTPYLFPKNQPTSEKKISEKNTCAPKKSWQVKVQKHVCSAPSHVSWLVFLLILKISSPVSAQDKVQQATQVKTLQELSQAYQIESQIQKQQAYQLAQKNGWMIREEFPDGTILELQGVDQNGHPIYYITDNIEAAQTTSTHQLWQGGSLGLNLSGLGMYSQVGGESYARLGEWDGGAVRVSHNEFTGGDNRVIQRDNSSIVINHATHVAGTLVGRGANPTAKGMAWQAPLDAHDWTQDEAEMALAASRGMLISNHSYGQIGGWLWDSYSSSWVWFGSANISEEEDYTFGFYDEKAANWDAIAYDAPYYLIVKSAGNDRGDGPGAFPQTAEKDGGEDGYDCITSSGNAKNVLTVGAVRSIPDSYEKADDVVMSTFSSWGPTDDGRIKPDICGNGVSVFSSLASSNSAYGNASGTSMSAPNVAGSLLLLQEHYENLNGKGNFMRAATLKALAIHTADEAGVSEGPDYQFGWGLMNSTKAAQLISQDFLENNALIREEKLNNQETFQISYKPDGSEPLVITLAWTDLAGTPTPISLNPTTLMLVNDLDIRISDGSQEYLPYILDPAQPNQPATRGDNFRDNVEKIFIPNPDPNKTYTITISHKGQLQSGAQDFSFIISGVNVPPRFAYDVGIIEIDGFNEQGCNNLINPQIKLVNFGKETLTAINIEYQLNDQNPQAIQWQGSLASKEELAITLPPLRAGDGFGQQFQVKVSLPEGLADEYESNNQLTEEFDGQIVVSKFPYLESFETGTGGWEVGGNTLQWEWGQPAGDIIKQASDGQRAWVTNLSGDYSGNQDSWLQSPQLDFSNVTSILLKVDIFNMTEADWDGVQLQVSKDCGQTWEKLGKRGLGINWYDNNSNTLSFLEFGNEAWSNQSRRNWVTAEYSIGELAGLSNVRLRFLFRSDGSIQSEGFAVDNFRLFGVGKTLQKITFEPIPEKTYGDDSFTLQAQSDAGLPLVFTSSDASVATITNNQVSIVGAGEVIISAFQEGNDTYAAAGPSTQTLQVNKAPLIAKADDKSRLMGDPHPSFTISYEGFVVGEDASFLDQLPKATSNSNLQSPAGAYEIQPAGGQDDNYTFQYQTGTLTVNPLRMADILLVDAETDQVITTLENGANISLAQLSSRSLSIVAEEGTANIGSVRMILQDPLNIDKVENNAPYALFGDNGPSDFFGENFPAGNYTVEITPYLGYAATLASGATTTINFTISDETAPVKIDQILLVDAENDQVIATLTEGMQIDFQQLASNNLTFVAEASSANVKSVIMNLRGDKDLTGAENTRPFSFFGDDGQGDFQGENFEPGQYTISALPFPERNLSGQSGTGLKINFSLVAGSAPAPDISLIEQVLLYNADTDQFITTIKNDANITLGSLNSSQFTINVLTDTELVKSVRLQLMGPTNHEQVESYRPFTLFGESSPEDFNGGTFEAGAYTLVITPYPERGAGGEAGPQETITFRIQTEPSIENILLIDAEKDQQLDSLAKEELIDLAAREIRELNFQAEVAHAESVRFLLRDASGAVVHLNTESVAPYTLFGDNMKGDYHSWQASDGNYTLEVTPYEMKHAKGAMGETRIHYFTVKQGSVQARARLDEGQEAIILNIYPNPSDQGYYKLRLSSGWQGEVQLEVSNTQGEIINRKVVSLEANQEVIDLNLEALGLKPGTYYLKISGNHIQETIKKIIKR